MTEIILGQVRFILLTVCGGMAFMLGYDFLRFMRWFFRFNKWIVALLDIIYGTLMGIPAYCIFFLYSEGAIRWYGILSLIAGICLYEYGISRPVRSLLVRRFGKVRRSFLRRKLSKIRKIIAKLSKKLYNEKTNP